ncbi:GTP diphosphokinase [Alteromonas sp. LMIT006]|uniref:GTP diphosphokinase n=1 Tax=Alteromonadaceae TaxID=72275 RepID=UPI0020CA6987|nr:GTP diphosphokinase [Alteromonas sp. LMIT006]UTP73656.1 GTP diphosphokinase [Alteromonas sp. LMIT006]
MVSVRSVHRAQRPPFDEWLSQLDVAVGTKRKLREIVNHPENLLIGQEMVEILAELNMDDVTLMAAMVFPYCEMHKLDEVAISQTFSVDIANLISGVRKMDAIKILQTKHQRNEAQVDNVRKMLLAMVEDVRAVVIKMAERICTLQRVKNEDEETRVMVARECSTVYAPLANRLGIGQLKWELEDLAFRYLHPQKYMQIASWLDEKRSERTQYIDDFVAALEDELAAQNIQAYVYGRPKHIFSIHKKMHKKGLSFEQLFDIRAVRVIAQTLPDCYAALGTVHAKWHHLVNEFDDYIATPKANGYQSIHTVIRGPEQRTIEIQIRTQQMHDDAELGVAAHWKYKEDHKGKTTAAEARITWLRKILAWQEEVAESGDLVEELRSQVFDDRVYVFTPNGDVIDLPVGSTPLDFAYYIHSNVGHRCIGAKVDGRIVPFTYKLQSGDQVEILTGKQLNPSRDWLHPGLGYVFSSRARAKIHTFFKKLDRDDHLSAGKELLERELAKLHFTIKDIPSDLSRFNVHQLEDLFVAVGAGDLRVMSVVHYIEQLHKPEVEIEPVAPKPTPQKPRKTDGHIEVEGVGNLMSSIANCCQPLPGEPISGYITQGRGVSVHKQDCEQLAHLLTQHPEREIEVNWSGGQAHGLQAKIALKCSDRTGLMRDIMTQTSNDKVPVLGINSISDTQTGTCQIDLVVEVSHLNSLNILLKRLRKIKGVIDAFKYEH